MATTANYNWPLPSPTGLQIAEMGKVANSLLAADVKVKAVETALASHKHAFADLLTIPTTIAGYGITDAMTRDQVTDAIIALRDELRAGAGAALDTFKEIAAALGDDPNFAATISTALGNRVRVDAASAFNQAQKAQGRSNIDALGIPDKGQANGVASLDGTGKVPSAQLPAMDYLPLSGGKLTGLLHILSSLGIIVEAETGLRLRNDGLKQIVFQSADGLANRGFIAGYENGVINIITAVGTSRTFTFNPNGQLYLPATSTDSTSAVRRDDMLARITEVNNSINTKVGSDRISIAGLWDGNLDIPYMRRASDNAVRYLQPSLGFTPSRQIGGNSVGFQWSGGSLNINIDNGGYTSQIVDSNNFLAWLNNQAVMRQNNYNYTLGAGAGAGAGQVCLQANMNSSGVALRTMDRGTVKGDITLNSNGTVTYGSVSDYRLKYDVVPLVTFTIAEDEFNDLDNSLLRVMGMRPVSYRFIDAPDELTHGFIAHELQQVAPHAVTGKKDGVKRLGRATVRGPLIMPEYATGDVVKEVQSAVYGPSTVYHDVTVDAFPGADWEYTHTVPDYQQVDLSKTIADLTAAVQSLTLMVLEQSERLKALEAAAPSAA